VGALKNNPRTSISLEAIAGGGDLVREITEVGIQVSKDLFHGGISIGMSLDNSWLPDPHSLDVQTAHGLRIAGQV
jgi:hypothetical protein